jgi:hypothetical protein
MLASAILGVCGIAVVTAANPPQPDFFWPYGKVQEDGQNIEPPVQSVIALVNGHACGDATTQVALAGPGVPVGDVGKTVYVVDVLADGAEPGDRAGCGHAGDLVSLYFPQLHRFAFQQATFIAGNSRIDIDLGPEMPFRLVGPLLANDGSNP